MDAAPVRHHQPARAVLHGRGVRLLPAGRDAAVQAAAADADEAGARVRAGRGAGDAESGRPRLQGPGQCRHLVHRPAADRARQGAGDRRPARQRCRGRHGQGAAGGGHVGPAAANLPDAQRARCRARAAAHTLGAVVPARTADLGRDFPAGGCSAGSRRAARGNDSGKRARAGRRDHACEIRRSRRGQPTARARGGAGEIPRGGGQPGGRVRAAHRRTRARAFRRCQGVGRCLGGLVRARPARCGRPRLGQRGDLQRRRFAPAGCPGRRCRFCRGAGGRAGGQGVWPLRQVPGRSPLSHGDAQGAALCGAAS